MQWDLGQLRPPKGNWCKTQPITSLLLSIYHFHILLFSLLDHLLRIFDSWPSPWQLGNSCQPIPRQKFIPKPEFRVVSTFCTLKSNKFWLGHNHRFTSEGQPSSFSYTSSYTLYPCQLLIKSQLIIVLN